MQCNTYGLGGFVINQIINRLHALDNQFRKLAFMALSPDGDWRRGRD